MTTRPRLSTVAEADTVGDVLAEAFADYPWTTWALGDGPRRKRLRELYRLQAGVAGAEQDATWVAEEGGQVVAAACWSRPDAPPLLPATEELLAARIPGLLGDRAAALEQADAAVRASRPPGTYWLLGCVGTRPAWRGRGIATRLVAAGLQVVETAGLPAVLDTSSPGNVRLYERLGFSVTAEVHPPHGAPLVWVMHRPARAGVPRPGDPPVPSVPAGRGPSGPAEAAEGQRLRRSCAQPSAYQAKPRPGTTTRP